MAHAGITVRDVTYDPTVGRYEGAVSVFDRSGSREILVSTPGHPAWGYDKTIEALVAAAQSTGFF